MNVILVEDEAPAARRLHQLITKVEPEVKILTVLDSIESTVNWLKQNPMPDLAFFDIELADGQSFEIFNQVQVTCPVVFTTAYDAYALKAFEVNSIDYLLKPIEENELLRALKKWHFTHSKHLVVRIQDVLQKLNQKDTFKTRLLIKIADKIFYVDVSDMAYFVSEEKYTWLITKDKKKYIVDHTLDELETYFEGSVFFRLNRQLLAHIQSIKMSYIHFNGKLKIDLIPTYNLDIYVSREKAAAFKKWIGS